MELIYKEPFCNNLTNIYHIFLNIFLHLSKFYELIIMIRIQNKIIPKILFKFQQNTNKKLIIIQMYNSFFIPIPKNLKLIIYYFLIGHLFHIKHLDIMLFYPKFYNFL